MNIKELKEFIKNLPDDMEICTKETKWDRGDFNIQIQTVFHEESGGTEEILVMQ